GYNIAATEGTYKYFVEHNVECKRVNKLYEGRPNLHDELMNGVYAFVINTPSPMSVQAQSDDSYLRKTVIRRKICYATTLSAAKAAVIALEYIKNNSAPLIKSLQEYHAEIK
ncbi:MAG: carbamoyl phosphate synthase large subunit, partial [Oscillospiraceae bacterium]|nr:carbamoyl phosphate synthase large subunit [Oscillospiraceae bacterium]